MTRSVAVVVLALFLAGVLAYVARHAAKLFAPRYGRSHRLVAGAYLLWLVAGAARCFGANEPATAVDAAAYDAVLGVLGTLTALTAARDFGQHATAKTSGTLDADAFVTRSEMVEHAFYQVLNFLQIMGLHALAAGAPGFAVLLAQTLPWAWRARFPVNSFSANYDAARGGGSPWALTNVMYRIKKYQYIFYKHALLHGLNISAALGRPPRIRGRRFRAYWLSLNAAYTHEFFLQTLVKRRLMAQPVMLLFNKFLMAGSRVHSSPRRASGKRRQKNQAGSSVAAIDVLRRYVDWRIAAVSFALNMLHRGHDVGNTLGLAVAAFGARDTLAFR
mmetsp:Transcript_14146/g.42169  ORF Transcript_14146/g.42169 Transcript_14146/m.42169 type:complete len:332 (-) Transcript_14146:69-1064(-)